MSSSDAGLLAKLDALGDCPGFQIAYAHGVVVAELTETTVVLGSPGGARSRLTFPAGPLAELLGTLVGGIGLAELASNAKALEADQSVAFAEVLSALADRRLLTIAWPAVDRPALSFLGAATRPGLQRQRLSESARLKLSALAVMHRVDAEMVLDFPPLGLRIALMNPALAGWLLAFNGQETVAERSRALSADYPGHVVAALIEVLAGVGILHAAGQGEAGNEDDGPLALWECHNLFFYTQSHAGYHFTPQGALPGAASRQAPAPLRRALPGGPVQALPIPRPPADPGWLAALEARHSVRDFAANRPVTLAELSALLYYTLRVRRTESVDMPTPGGTQTLEVAYGPAPTAGACHALEVFVCVGVCQGLAPGLYAYDALEHGLQFVAGSQAADALRQAAARSMGRDTAPPLALAITARFERVFWKYRGVSLANVLRDVGALYQTLYLGAQGLGLAGCAIGNVDIASFERASGLPFAREGAVGLFALGHVVAAGETGSR